MTYAALSLLSDLRSKDIDWILSNSELRTVLANTVLVREEQPSDSIFLVSDGLFEVYVFANSASQRKINQLGPGDVIGEVSWLDRKPISASVRAIESSSVIAINTDTLDRKLNEDSEFAVRFLRSVARLAAERVRGLTSYVRRSEWARSEFPTTSESPLGTLRDLKMLIAAADKRALELNGVIPDPFPDQIRAMFDRLEGELNKTTIEPFAELI